MGKRAQRWGALGAAILAGVLIGTTAFAAADTGEAPRVGIDADTVDGHHAGPSNGKASQRANRVLWATSSGKISTKALPMAALDKRYLGAMDDTLLYVPGSLLRFHMDDGTKASVEFNMTSQAIVRKEGSAGDVFVDIPMPLEAQQSGRWVRLVNMRVYYKVDNAASYIDAIWLHKINATGGHITMASSGTDGNSTSWTSLFLSCDSADCQLSWPTGGFVTTDMQLHFAGTGDAHEITISGVLLRISYDG